MNMSGGMRWDGEALRRYGLALVYVCLAGFVVIHLEGRHGHMVSTWFGVQFPRLIVYPIGFWALTALYVLAAAPSATSFPGALAAGPLRLPGSRVSTEQLAAQTSTGLRLGFGQAAGMGAVLHLSLLWLVFLSTHAAATLPARYFASYATGASILGLGMSCALSWRCLARMRRGVLDPLQLPLVFLPVLAALVLPWSLAVPTLLLSAGIALLVRGGRGSQAARRLHRACRSHRAWGIAIVLVALVFRVVAAWRLSQMGLETVIRNSDDGERYYWDATTLLSGARITNAGSVGYSAMVAALRWLAHQHLTIVLMIQACLSAVACLGVYEIGRRLHGLETAAIAGLLCAMSQLLIFNSVNLTREMAAIVFMVGSLVLALRLLRVLSTRAQGGIALGLGIAWGLLVTIDPVFVPIGLLFCLSLLRYRRWAWRGRLATVGIILAGLLGVVLAINDVTTGHASLQTRTTWYAIHVSKDFNPYAKMLFARQINLFAFPRESFGNFVRDPLVNLSLLGQKLWLDARRYFFEGNAGAFDPLLLVTNSFLAGNLLCYAYGLSVIGIGVAIRTARQAQPLWRWQAGVVYGLPCLFAAAHIVLLFGMTRYRATIQPLLLLWTALGLRTFLKTARGAWGGATR